MNVCYVLLFLAVPVYNRRMVSGAFKCQVFSLICAFGEILLNAVDEFTRVNGPAGSTNEARVIFRVYLL